MKIGVDYYPEQWDSTLWENDVERMAQIGVKVVRLGEFAWSCLEPQPDQFDFAWLDTIVAMLSEKGIEIVLGTPTNCPPLWLYRRYPDAVQTGADGRKIATGIRGHRCYHQPDFLAYAKRIVQKTVRRYRENPHIVAYQIDNELEANFCRCPICQERFRDFLRRKYQTLEHLNHCYGNAVWSGAYASWDEVTAPMGNHPKAWYSPALQLDYHRFAAADATAYAMLQRDWIREISAEIPITTNTWFCENTIDFHQMFQGLDFVSYDNYPTTSVSQDEEALDSHAFHLDLMRGVKQQPFWIMEQLSGSLGSWMPMQRTPVPNMLQGYALQAFAHGADTVVHFRWRTACTGAEMFWHGLLDHSGKEGRRFAEFAQLCQTAESLKDAKNASYPARVAILYGAEQDFALRIQPQTEGFHYFHQMKLYHDAFSRWGVNVDIVQEHSDLDSYAIVVAPTLFLSHPAVTEALHRFTARGGVLLLTNRSGVKNEYNNCHMDTLPAGFQKLVGAYVAEYDPIGNGKNTVLLGEERFPVFQWCDVLVPTTAEVLAVYAEQFYRGRGAIVRNRYEKGTAYYIGTVVGRKLCKILAQKALEDAGLPYQKGLPEHVELSIRETEQTQFWFWFNCQETAVTFSQDDREYRLQPFEMLVERRNK